MLKIYLTTYCLNMDFPWAIRVRPWWSSLCSNVSIAGKRVLYVIWHMHFWPQTNFLLPEAYYSTFHEMFILKLCSIFNFSITHLLYIWFWSLVFALLHGEYSLFNLKPFKLIIARESALCAMHGVRVCVFKCKMKILGKNFLIK